MQVVSVEWLQLRPYSLVDVSIVCEEVRARMPLDFHPRTY